jgi:hypothetical protein
MGNENCVSGPSAWDASTVFRMTPEAFGRLARESVTARPSK